MAAEVVRAVVINRLLDSLFPARCAKHEHAFLPNPE
jgi:hypothetical protein